MWAALKKQLSRPAAWAVYSWAFAILTAIVSNAQIDKYKDETANAKARADYPLHALFADYKWLLMGLLVALTGIPAVISAVKAGRARERVRTGLLQRHLRLMRRRIFPAVRGASQARLSLFERSRDGKYFKCLYRTDDTMPKRTWPIDKDEGMVVQAFRYEVKCEAKELIPGNPADLARYLAETWSTREILDDRTWKGAAMLAIPVTVRPGGHPEAVFLIEALGTPIGADTVFQEDIDMCCLLMEELP